METLKDSARKYGTPLYVYDKSKIKSNLKKIKNSLTYPKNEIFFPLMSNNNLEILKFIKILGLKIQVNSENEINLAEKAGFPSEKISFTSTGLGKELIKKLIKEKIEINLDSIEEVEKFCSLTKKSKFGVRIAIPKSIRLKSNSVTNDSFESNVGISHKDFNKIIKIANETDNKINGVHGYFASNVLKSEPFIEFGNFIAEQSKNFLDLEYVNFGSGFGVKYSQEETEFNFKEVLGHYSNLIEGLSKKLKREIILKIEPGRSLIVNAGILLTRVMNIKKLGDEKCEISVDAGFGELARPMIYGAYHEIKNIERLDKPIKLYDIRANTVLQNDFLGKNRKLEEVNEGDVLIIENVGAYGSVMASGFPGKKLPKEIVLEELK